MIAAIIGQGGIVVNRIVVEQLMDEPFMVAGENCAIGDIWTGSEFVKPVQQQEDN